MISGIESEFARIEEKEGAGSALLSIDLLLDAKFFEKRTAMECMNLGKAFYRQDYRAWETSKSKPIIIEKLSKFIDAAGLDECLALVNKSISSSVFQLPKWDLIFSPGIARQIYEYLASKGDSRKHFLFAKLKMRILNLCQKPEDYDKAIAAFKAYGNYDFSNYLAKKRFA